MEALVGKGAPMVPSSSGSLWSTWLHRLPTQERHHVEWAALLLAAIALFCVRIPFLPPTFDDIDGINFDLGVHDYDPAAYRPHPPGYAVFILFAKLAHPFFTSHAAALAFPSALFSALSVLPLYLLMRELAPRAEAALACVLTLLSPLVWFNGVRPMSDSTGLFAVLVSQCLLVKGMGALNRDAPEARKLWLWGVLIAGLAIGTRLQAGLLVGPMLVWGFARHRQIRTGTAACLAVSVALWIVPVLYLSGGAGPYVQSLRLLIAAALPVEPLLSEPTIRGAVVALWDVLGAPWGTPWLAVPVLCASALGAVRMMRTNRRGLAFVLALFLPYAVYHYLLQMTETIRYAIPLVPLTALLAAGAFAGGRRLRLPRVAVAGVAFVAISAAWTWPALAAYEGTSSPAAQALAAVHGYKVPSDSVVIAGHHVFERYLARLQASFTVLPSDPQKALRPLRDYWRTGGRKPILFLRNPARTTLLKLERSTQTRLGRWSWPSSVHALMKGERPTSVELVRLDPPLWFTESGFLISREAGLPDEVARQRHRLYMRPGAARRVVMASGSLPDTDQTKLALAVDGRMHGEWHVQREFTLRTVLDPLHAGNYLPLSFTSPVPVLFTDVWIGEEDRPAIRPAKGFHFPEADDAGRVFRWMSPEAELAGYLPRDGARLRIRGWVPTDYYELPVTISLASQGRVHASFVIRTSEFDVECTLPSTAGSKPWGTFTLTSSHHFVPDEWQKNGDRRRLAVRIYELRVSAR